MRGLFNKNKMQLFISIISISKIHLKIKHKTLQSYKISLNMKVMNNENYPP